MKSVNLHECARMNRIEGIRLAIANGANLNAKDDFGATALHYAIAEKNRDLISLLIRHDVDVTVQDSDGKTPLHYAIEHDMPHVAEELLKKNPAIIAIADKFGNQPLWTAVFNAKGKYELVSLLVNYGAEPGHRNNSKLAPIDIPTRIGDRALLRILQSKDSGQL